MQSGVIRTKQVKPPASTTQAPKASSNTDGYEDYTKAYVTEMLEENCRKLLTENAELREKLEQYEKRKRPEKYSASAAQAPIASSNTDTYDDHTSAYMIEMLQNSNRKLISENTELREKLEGYEKSSDTYGYEDQTKEFVTEMLEENNRKLLIENTKLREKLEGVSTADSQNKEKIKILEDEISELKAEKERLSQSIADLQISKQHTEICEHFYEIYDNEWTTALEELMDKYQKTEEDGITELLNILGAAYSYCSRKAWKLTMKMKNLFRLFMSEGEMQDLPAEMNEMIRSQRKSVDVFLDKLQKGLTTKSFAGVNITKYQYKCVAVCWCMVNQDPPLYLDLQLPKGNFNKDLYKGYTKVEKSYKFLVWPVLYLHKSGPVLAKGIAQGK